MIQIAHSSKYALHSEFRENIPKTQNLRPKDPNQGARPLGAENKKQKNQVCGEQARGFNLGVCRGGSAVSILTKNVVFRVQEEGDRNLFRSHYLSLKLCGILV